MKKLMLLMIKFYQKAISPLLPKTCRFHPTCSDYCIQAIEKYGPLKGFVICAKRVGKCHPFHPGGFDPLK
ncbi:membrane protein insertion efficiency factor YidD [Alkalibacter saccharofermentans]|uniref:membrane protein insertion efficiency factor YidD n=1 Tax=Alkalibacter saccharofermentans TaxID=235931 RepID=UPI0009345516|nr:membrane protein insertion efficiency factor YidD [Alkalibacter saccharofermentans]